MPVYHPEFGYVADGTFFLRALLNVSLPGT
jgi:hypothetical protein